MLFRVTGAAQWDGVAISGLHCHTTVGACTHMRGMGWRCLASGYAGQLPNKSQVLHAPAQVGLGLATRYGAGDAGSGHRSKGLPAPSCPGPEQPLWLFLIAPNRTMPCGAKESACFMLRKPRPGLAR